MQLYHENLWLSGAERDFVVVPMEDYWLSIPMNSSTVFTGTSGISSI